MARTIAIVALILMSGAIFGYDWLNKSDFDRMCDVMTRLASDPEFAKLDPAAGATRLAEEIQKKIYAPPAIRAFQALAVADPASRLMLLRMAAQETRGGPWECPAATQFFGTPGRRKQ